MVSPILSCWDGAMEVFYDENFLQETPSSEIPLTRK